jgi:hypothetical protein
MMHPDPSPTISVGIIVRPGAEFDGSHHWRNDAGTMHAAVRFDAGGYSYGHIQGEPAALRELAAALVLAADQADQADPAEEADPAEQGDPVPALAVGAGS